MASTSRNKKTRQKSLVLAASVSPVIIILALPLIVGWGQVTPEMYESGLGDGSAAPEIVAQLSSDLNAIAIAVIVGAAVLLREWRSQALPTKLWLVTSLIVSTAIASCYAGVRFRFAIAEQIPEIPFNLGLIADRLTTQGVLLLGSVSGLIYMALLTLVGPTPVTPQTHPMEPAPATPPDCVPTSPPQPTSPPSLPRETKGSVP